MEDIIGTLIISVGHLLMNFTPAQYTLFYLLWLLHCLPSQLIIITKVSGYIWGYRGFYGIMGNFVCVQIHFVPSWHSMSWQNMRLAWHIMTCSFKDKIYDFLHMICLKYLLGLEKMLMYIKKISNMTWQDVACYIHFMKC